MTIIIEVDIFGPAEQLTGTQKGTSGHISAWQRVFLLLLLYICILLINTFH